MKTVRGDETTDSKREKGSSPCPVPATGRDGERERPFEACKVHMGLHAPSVQSR